MTLPLCCRNACLPCGVRGGVFKADGKVVRRRGVATCTCLNQKYTVSIIISSRLTCG
jgi:hypothetical protein